MFGCFLLLLHDLAHEVAQELRTGAVAGFRGGGELVFQGFIDPEGKGCFAQGAALMCYIATT